MRRFLLLWFVLASSWFVASLLIDFFADTRQMLQVDSIVVLMCTTLAQSAVLQSIRFFRSRPHASSDQYR